MEVIVDFVADLAAQWRAELVQRGHAVPEGTAPVTIGKMLFNLLHKHIEPCPRRIHLSAELEARRLPEGTSRALAGFVVACENGADINTYQSDKARDPSHNDGLLNDWGIRHFHLGARRTRKGSRSRELLFAFVDADDVFLLDVLDHQDNESFDNAVLMEILRSNWPSLLEPLELTGFSPFTMPITSKGRRLLRETGVEPLLQLDGKLFVPLGGGIMGTGVSRRVMDEVLGGLHAARFHQQRAIDMADEVQRRFEAETGTAPSKLYVRGIPRGDEWEYEFSDEPFQTVAS